MKRLSILCGLAMLVGSLNAQIAEDAYIKAQLLGYSNGCYVIKVTSKQNVSCNPDITIYWQNCTITQITPDTKHKNQINNNAIVGQSDTFYLKGAFSANAVFNITDLSICQWMGSSPTTLCLMVPSNLPITFKSVTSTNLGNGYIQVVFEVADVSGINYYNIQTSTDGKTFKTVTVQFPDDTQPNTTYTVKIKAY